MKIRVTGFLKRGAMILAVALFTLLAVRAWDKQRGPPLEPWHTHAPPELSRRAAARRGLGRLARGGGRRVCGHAGAT